MNSETVARPQTIVYIGGFNFYHGAIKGTQYKLLDFAALCQRMLPRDQLIKIRYFTSRISARPGDPQQPVRQEAYLRALARALVESSKARRSGPSPNHRSGWGDMRHSIPGVRQSIKEYAKLNRNPSS